MPLVVRSTFGELECSRDQQECNLQYTWLVITGTSRCVRLFCDARGRLSVGCGMFLFNLSPSNNIPVFSHANDDAPEAFEENRGLVWKLAASSSWPIDHADIKSFLQLVLTNMQLAVCRPAGKLVRELTSYSKNITTGVELWIDDSQFWLMDCESILPFFFQQVYLLIVNVTLLDWHILGVLGQSPLAGVQTGALRKCRRRDSSSSLFCIRSPHFVSHTHTHTHTHIYSTHLSTDQ